MKTWNEDTDGQLSEVSMKKKFEALGYSVNVYRYSPGTSFPDHTHAVDKIDGVLSGRFRITLLGSTYELGPGDYLLVPAGAVHCAEVIGNEPVISLDGVRNR